MSGCVGAQKGKERGSLFERQTRGNQITAESCINIYFLNVTECDLRQSSDQNNSESDFFVERTDYFVIRLWNEMTGYRVRLNLEGEF